jgi:hypothetical protein
LFDRDRHLLYERDRVPFTIGIGMACMSGIGYLV